MGWGERNDNTEDKIPKPGLLAQGLTLAVRR